jgi:hypothetical protein
MSTAKELDDAIARHIGGGVKVQTTASRSKIRRDLREAKIAALREAVETIRRKSRETPAWASGYNSAVTVLELQIAALDRTVKGYLTVASEGTP